MLFTQPHATQRRYHKVSQQNQYTQLLVFHSNLNVSLYLSQLISLGTLVAVATGLKASISQCQMLHVCDQTAPLPHTLWCVLASQRIRKAIP